MLAGNLMESPVNAALQLRPESFNRIRVNRSANIFALTVSNAVMVITSARKDIVSGVFVRADNRTGFHHVGGVSQGDTPRNAGDNVCTNFAATLDNAHDGDLVASGCTRAANFLRTLGGVHVRCFAANVGFVRFNDTGEKVATLSHQLANLMRHAPSRLVGNAGLTLNFLGAHTVLRSRHQEHDMEPRLEGRAGLVEDRPFARVNLMAAIRARVATARFNAVERVLLRAHRAGAPVRVALVKDVIQARSVVGKLLVEFFEGVTFGFHANRIPDSSHA